jgi:hypothetical protein
MADYFRRALHSLVNLELIFVASIIYLFRSETCRDIVNTGRQCESKVNGAYIVSALPACAYQLQSSRKIILRNNRIPVAQTTLQ